MTRALTREDLDASQIPQLYWEARADKIPEGPDRVAILAYLRSIPGALHIPAGAYIYGQVGRGKTCAAVVALKVARANGCPGLFVNLPAHIDRIKAREDIPRYDLETSFAAALTKLDLVVLDDVRASDLREKWFGADELAKFLRRRSDARRATILTSRMSFTELARLFPEVAEAATGVLRPVVLTGPDQREDRVQAVNKVFGGGGGGGGS